MTTWQLMLVGTCDNAKPRYSDNVGCSDISPTGSHLRFIILIILIDIVITTIIKYNSSNINIIFLVVLLIVLVLTIPSAQVGTMPLISNDPSSSYRNSCRCKPCFLGSSKDHSINPYWLAPMLCLSYTIISKIT
jgi:hypothetical protein